MEPQADHIDEADLVQIWQAMEFEEKTAIRDRTIILAQNPKSKGQRLGYKGLHRMVKKN